MCHLFVHLPSASLREIMTPEQRHYNMSRIRGKNTTPELKVRRWLHGHGYRYRVNVRKLHGTPDIVLAKYRTCIFINGCFWHGHDGCRYYTHPKTNVRFWEEKVSKNRLRDQIVTAKLESMRWKVITIWECELKGDRFEKTMEDLLVKMARNREEWINGKEARRKAIKTATFEAKVRKAQASSAA